MGDSTVQFDGGLRLTIHTPQGELCVALTKQSAQLLAEKIRRYTGGNPPEGVTKNAGKVTYIAASSRNPLDVIGASRSRR